jgi:outer membrane protein with beta-barrel domain
MKRSIATIIGILVICVSVSTVKGADMFHASELSLSLFGGWVDKDDADLAPGAGLTYFLTEHIGVGALTHWDNFDGKFIDNVSAEAYFRLPLAGMLAPYGLAALGYSFETEESFESFGAGAEFRFNENWGAFGDVRWQINNDTDDGAAIRVGARLVF